jgi:hypothetical protein
MTARPAPPPRWPLALLGLLTVLAFGGPFVIALVLGGGRRASWPPDRAVEWWTFGLVCGAVAVLMGACLALALRSRPTSPEQPGPPASRGPAP